MSIVRDEDLLSGRVASGFIALTKTYVEFGVRLGELTGEVPDGIGEVFSELHGAAPEDDGSFPAVAARLASQAGVLLQEARSWADEHFGHGCDYEEIARNTESILAELTEMGAVSLSSHEAEQVRSGQIAETFHHMLHFLTGPASGWLLTYAEEQDERFRVEQLISSSQQALHTLHSDGDGDDARLSMLFIYDLEEEQLSELQGLSEGAEPDEGIAIALDQSLEFLVNEFDLDASQIHLSLMAEQGQAMLALEWIDTADFLASGLLDSLRQLQLPFSLFDRVSCESREEVLHTLYLPGMAKPLTRRGQILAETPVASIHSYQIGSEEHSLLGSDPQLVADYLQLGVELLEDRPSAELIRRLDRLADQLDSLYWQQ